MRLLVLSSPNSWYLEDLRRAAGDRHEVCCGAFDRIAVGMDSTGAPNITAGEYDLSEFHAVLVRTMPPGSLEQIVFRMDALGQLQRSGVVVLNPPRAIEAAVDKYLATAKLRAAGLRTPGTVVCQTVDDAMAGYRRLGGDVVVKPLFGSEGRGLMRVEDEGLALRVFKTLERLDAVIYLQEFVPHQGFDIRLLVIGGRVLAMRRRNPNDWRTNVSRGAAAEPLEADDVLVELAQSASAAVVAPFSGVDILPGHDEQLHVLEVNAIPGWKALAATLQVDVAAMVLNYVEQLVHHKPPVDIQPVDY
jgi:ribosomal protein S6--L-glutamate ligase